MWKKLPTCCVHSHSLSLFPSRKISTEAVPGYAFRFPVPPPTRRMPPSEYAHRIIHLSPSLGRIPPMGSSIVETMLLPSADTASSIHIKLIYAKMSQFQLAMFRNSPDHVLHVRSDTKSGLMHAFHLNCFIGNICVSPYPCIFCALNIFILFNQHSF